MMERKNSFITLASSICLWLVFTNSIANAQETMQKNQEQASFDASEIKTVQVNSEQPVHLSFIGSGSDSVQINYLSDKKMRVGYSVSRVGNKLILTFNELANQKLKNSREERETWIDHLLNGDWNKNNGRYRERNEFQITLPRDLNLDLNTEDSYLGIHHVPGSVSAAGSDNHFEIDSLGRNLTIDGENQRITGNGVGGTVSVNNHDGSVDLRGIGGPVSINGHDSDINLEDVRDSVDLILNDGSTGLRTINGNVTARGDNVHFELEDIKGSVSLNGRDYHLNASDIYSMNFDGSDTWLSIDHVNGGGVRIKNNNGTVKLDEIHGPVNINGSDLGVTLNYIHDETSLDINGSHVAGYRLMNNVSLEGSDTSIGLDEYQGHRFVANSGSGVINLTMSNRVDSILINRRSGDVTIRMLQSYSGGYQMTTGKGRIYWSGKEPSQIYRKGGGMELSGGNKNRGYIHIELDRGDIRIN